MQFAGTDRYYLSPELREIVNIAIAMEKPLLLTGEAGTGKTQLAFEICPGPRPEHGRGPLQVHVQGRRALLRL